MMEILSGDFIIATLRAATPLILAALGVLLAERAGVMFIGVEGVMLAGALVGVLGVIYGGSAWSGVLATLAVGILLGLLLAYVTVHLPTEQVATGIAFNIASLGLTSFVFRLAADRAQGLIPGVPSIIWGISPFALTAILFTITMWWFLFRTGPGLKLRSVGENSHAASAAGINVVTVRSLAVIAAAVLAALGGAALTMGWVRSFADNVTLGRGFIALAAVYFGRWNPIFAIGAALLFGAGEALAFRAQAAGAGINPYYYLMLPYVLTLVIVGITGQARGPGDVGKPYLRR